jgi:Tfp pilus assembly protein PilE
MNARRARRASAGFAYLEVLIAALILAVCAAPAADAIRNGLAAGPAGSAKAAELRCARNRMEAVLAEPFVKLYNAAGTDSYSLPADATCLARVVTIRQMWFDGASLTPLPANASTERQELALLLVKVALVDASTGYTSDYSFSTVVSR